MTTEEEYAKFHQMLKKLEPKTIGICGTGHLSRVGWLNFLWNVYVDPDIDLSAFPDDDEIAGCHDDHRIV